MKQAKDIKNLKKPEKKAQSQTRRLQELSLQDTESLIRELEAHRDELFEKHNEELQRLQKELEDSGNECSDLYDFAPIGYFMFDGNGLILDGTDVKAGLLGIKKQFLINKPFATFIEVSDRNIFRAHRMDVLLKQARQICEIRLKSKDGKIFYAQLQSLPVKDPEGNLTCLRTALSDITKLMDTEDSLLLALHETLKRGEEISALLESTRSVLKYHDFEKTAESIYHSCKNLLKADCGYIALLKNNGTENDVLFLDTGDCRCAVEPSFKHDHPGTSGNSRRYHENNLS